MRAQGRQQLGGAGQWSDAVKATDERVAVQFRERRDHLPIELSVELAGERVYEQAAAHPDPAVDLPHGQADTHALERVAPGDHVLIDAVDERSVEVEQKRRLAAVH